MRLTEMAATNHLPRKVKIAVEKALVGIIQSGSVQAIVWGGKYAGVDQSHCGVVVTVRQYSMQSYRFSVRNGNLYFRGRLYRSAPLLGTKV